VKCLFKWKMVLHVINTYNHIYINITTIGNVVIPIRPMT
jgi:hypothetical protein